MIPTCLDLRFKMIHQTGNDSDLTRASEVKRSSRSPAHHYLYLVWLHPSASAHLGVTCEEQISARRNSKYASSIQEENRKPSHVRSYIHDFIADSKITYLPIQALSPRVLQTRQESRHSQAMMSFPMISGKCVCWRVKIT